MKRVSRLRHECVRMCLHVCMCVRVSVSVGLAIYYWLDGRGSLRIGVAVAIRYKRMSVYKKK